MVYKLFTEVRSPHSMDFVFDKLHRAPGQVSREA